ncbi:MAG: S1 family peptidase [Opitutales bacterium]
MKQSIYVLTCTALALLTCSCATFKEQITEKSAVTVIDDKSVRVNFEEQLAQLIKSGEYSSLATLRKQLSRQSCELALPPTGSTGISPSQIYEKRLGSTLLVGKFYRCSNEHCKKIHASIASGVVIRRDGIVVTNYHVVESGNSRYMGMGAMTADGTAYLVDEVLAADEASDVAILRLRSATDLPAAPLFRDEPVGSPVTIISNPVGRFFTLTTGHVSRYYLNSEGGCFMNVTADFAKGSSGAPIFNNRGDVVGLVANTLSLTTQQVPLQVDEESNALEVAPNRKSAHTISGQPLFIGNNHQMTIMNTAPSRAILDLIEE